MSGVDTDHDQCSPDDDGIPGDQSDGRAGNTGLELWPQESTQLTPGNVNKKFLFRYKLKQNLAKTLKENYFT